MITQLFIEDEQITTEQAVAAFKTLRHIETVRNYIDRAIRELMDAAIDHDQSKLQPPEAVIFGEHTAALRDIEYGSDAYKERMKLMKPAIDHHNSVNPHHPEHFEDGIHGMNLIELLVMILDWKASGMRHATGDLVKSIEINQERFGYSDELKKILMNTATAINTWDVKHHAEES